MSNINFSYTNFGLLLLFSFFILYLYWCLSSWSRRHLAKIISEANIPEVAKRKRRLFWGKVLALVFAQAFLAFALMGPYRLEPRAGAEIPASIDEVVFCLDVSRSMSAKDAQNNSTRLLRAKEILHTIVENLGGVEVSLVAFAGGAQEVVPSTLDYLYFLFALDGEELDSTPVSGTNFQALFDFLEAKYFHSNFKKRVRVVLLSDGEDTFFMNGKAKEKEKILETVSSFAKEGIYVDAIGLGSPQGVMISPYGVKSSLDISFLMAVALHGKGRALFDRDLPLVDISKAISEKILSPHDGDYKEAKRDFFALFILLAAFFLALFQIIPARLVFLLFFIPSTLQAADLRQGISYFEEKQYDLAKASFHKELKGPLSPEERAIILYNLGTVCLEEGQYEEALRYFSDVVVESLSHEEKAAFYQNFSLCQIYFARNLLLLMKGIPPPGVEEALSKAEVMMKFLDSKKKKALHEEILITRAEASRQLESFQNRTPFLVIEEELLSLIETRKDISLYKAAILEQLERRIPGFREKYSKLPSEKLLEALDDARKAQEMNEAPSHKRLERALELAVEAETMAALDRRGGFWEKRKDAARSAIKQLLEVEGEEIGRLRNRFATACAKDLLSYYRAGREPLNTLMKTLLIKKEATKGEFWALKDRLGNLYLQYCERLEKEWPKKDALIDLWLLLDPRDCFFSLLAAGVADPNAFIVDKITASYEKIKEQIVPKEKMSAVDLRVRELSRNDKKIIPLLLLGIQYELLYSDLYQEKFSEFLKFCKKYEKRAVKYEGNNFAIVSDTTRKMLDAMRQKKLPKELDKEAENLTLLSQSTAPLVFIFFHEEVLKFIDKITEHMQEKQREAKEEAVQIPSKAEPVLPDQSIRNVLRMQEDDTMKKSEQKRREVPRPW
jgi:hypothetical protein